MNQIITEQNFHSQDDGSGDEQTPLLLILDTLYLSKEIRIPAQVQIPVSAQVGIWRSNIQTNHSGRRDARNDFHCEEDTYVLFNPWCKSATSPSKENNFLPLTCDFLFISCTFPLPPRSILQCPYGVKFQMQKYTECRVFKFIM